MIREKPQKRKQGQRKQGKNNHGIVNNTTEGGAGYAPHDFNVNNVALHNYETQGHVFIKSLIEEAVLVNASRFHSAGSIRISFQNDKGDIIKSPTASLDKWFEEVDFFHKFKKSERLLTVNGTCGFGFYYDKDNFIRVNLGSIAMGETVQDDKTVTLALNEEYIYMGEPVEVFTEYEIGKMKRGVSGLYPLEADKVTTSFGISGTVETNLDFIPAFQMYNKLGQTISDLIGYTSTMEAIRLTWDRMISDIKFNKPQTIYTLADLDGTEVDPQSGLLKLTNELKTSLLGDSMIGVYSEIPEPLKRLKSDPQFLMYWTQIVSLINYWFRAEGYSTTASHEGTVQRTKQEVTTNQGRIIENATEKVGDRIRGLKKAIEILVKLDDANSKFKMFKLPKNYNVVVEYKVNTDTDEIKKLEKIDLQLKNSMMSRAEGISEYRQIPIEAAEKLANEIWNDNNEVMLKDDRIKRVEQGLLRIEKTLPKDRPDKDGKFEEDTSTEPVDQNSNSNAENK